MSTHDYTVDNQGFPSFRADMNGALQALASTNFSATAPTVTFPGMLWGDSVANQLKVRNAANSGWVVLLNLNEDFGGNQSLKSTEGWSSQPSGILYQWCSASFTISGNANTFYDYAITFPKAFSTVYRVYITPHTSLYIDRVVGLKSWTTTTCTVSVAHTAANFTSLNMQIGVWAVGLE